MITDALLLDELVARLQSTWAPLFAVFVREKRERQTGKRWQPALTADGGAAAHEHPLA